MMMGIAMHVVTDAYAHKADIYDKIYKRWRPLGDVINNETGKLYKPDGINDFPNRWKCAKMSCNWILWNWKGNYVPSYLDFDWEETNKFKLYKFKTYSLAGTNGTGAIPNYLLKEIEKMSCFD